MSSRPSWAGTQPPPHNIWFDLTFLNPFATNKAIKNASFPGNTLGARYLYAQYILWICLIFVFVLLTLTGGNKGMMAAFGYSITWLFIYYNVSCTLIPEGSARCFAVSWIFTIIPWIIFTIVFVAITVTAYTLANKLQGGSNKSITKKRKKSLK